VSQYNYHDSIKVKARAGYRCEVCGSDQMVQAHAPGGDHSDWRNGQCLCVQHHSEQHPELPRGLFAASVHQPYWPNIAARALAVECGCHSRTIVRASRKLKIPSGDVLSEADKQRLKGVVQRYASPKNSYECLRCGCSWLSCAMVRPNQCPSCGSRDWDVPCSRYATPLVERTVKTVASAVAPPRKCPQCRSTRIIKNGHARLWKQGVKSYKQRYLCENCGRQFVEGN